MTRVMVDATMASKLKNFKDPILLCDPSGEIIGRVTPPSPYDDVVVPFSEAELQEAEEEPEESKLAEILAELEKK